MSAATPAPINLVVIGVFALSIPVAFVSPFAATLMWLTIFFIGRWVTSRATAQTVIAGVG